MKNIEIISKYQLSIQASPSSNINLNFIIVSNWHKRRISLKNIHDRYLLKVEIADLMKIISSFLYSFAADRTL